MSTLSLCWNLLNVVGGLPDEVILKILYEFHGFRHPIVNILLNSTKVKEYEDLQKIPFSRYIYKFYLNKEKYSNLFGIDIINYLNNKQSSYFRECISYVHYEDPGYFFPRQFGRLYYNTNTDKYDVETKLNIDWNLKKIKSKNALWYFNWKKKKT
jgi:hypothetical protein